MGAALRRARRALLRVRAHRFFAFLKHLLHRITVPLRWVKSDRNFQLMTNGTVSRLVQPRNFAQEDLFVIPSFVILTALYINAAVFCM